MSDITEKVLEDAEIAATYLRALIDKGVPMVAAVSLTSSYVQAHQITESQKSEPKKPWEE